MRDSQLFDLLLHCEWADATLWTACFEHEDVTGGAEGDLSSADEPIVDWLHHIHMVQHAFAAVWSGSPLDLENLPEPEDHADLLGLARWGALCHREIQQYLVTCDGVDLERRLTFPWAAQMEEAWQHPLEPVTLQESVHQLVLHSAHHRGQVAARLRQLGGEPPAMDYVVWLWRGRPDTLWPT